MHGRDNSGLTWSAHLASPTWTRAVGLLVVILAGAIYLKSLSSPFLFDDAGAVLRNPTIRRLASWQTFLPPQDGSTTTGRPLVNLSYALNYAWTGEKVWSYHVLNVGLHTFSALLVYGILLQVLSFSSINKSIHGNRVVLAFAIAWWWAWHPLQTESVVGISQRTELLSSAFYLLAVLGFLKGAQSSRPRCWFVLSILAAGAGMASKETVVTVPVMICFIDRALYHKSWRETFRQRTGYYIGLAATWLVLLALLISTGGTRGVSAGLGLGVSPWNYLLRQSDALLLYLKLSVWPHPLVADYGTSTARLSWAVAAAGSLVLILLASTCWIYIRKPRVGILGIWFFVILAPSSSFIPLVGQTVAEHRMYLPLLPILAGIILGCQVMFPRALLPLVACGGLVFGGLTWVRIRDYREALTLWTRNVADYPQSARGQNNLGVAYLKDHQPAQAVIYFRQALAIDPRYISALYNLGSAELEMGKPAAAAEILAQAVGLAPTHADAQVNYANALVRTGRAKEAVAHYKAALEMAPAADVYYNLGVVYSTLGQDGEAVDAWRLAAAQNPQLAGPRRELARAEVKSGHDEAARRDFIETLRIDPNDFEARVGLGLLFAQRGELAEAGQQFATAVSLRPESPEAQANLGNILLLTGHPREALEQYERVLRANPNDDRMRENIQVAREALRQPR